jgi:hypothetical protein
MSLSLRRLLKRWSQPSLQGHTNRRRSTARPWAELLEDRTLLSFSAPLSVPVGSRLASLVSADLNGDHRADLVTANRYDNTVSVLLGNGDGTFAAPVSYAAGDGPVFVTAADLTGSGNPDLLVADAGPGYGPEVDTVSVLLNNGDGSFGPAQPITVGDAPSGIAVGDFNHDGHLDLAVANRDSNTVSVLLGNGDGTFQAGTTLTTDAAPSAISTANFNGQLGLVVACSGSNTVDVFLGQGGTFTGPVSYTVGADPSGLLVQDLNGDGQADIVTANTNDGKVSVLLGNGDGTFGPATSFAAGPGPVAVLAADFTGNGVPDLAVVDSGSPDGYYPNSAVSLLQGRGDGTFLGPIVFRTGYDALAGAVADFNGDGRPDVATANWNGLDVSVLLNDGAWFAAPLTVPTSGPVSSVTTADLTGDGRLDMVVAGPGSLSVLLRQADGSYTSSASFNDCYGSVAIADLNHDGIPDLIYSGGAGVIVCLGNGDGTFGAATSYAVGYVQAVAVGDFRNDGNIDIATANYPYLDQDNVGILWGNGEGTFQPVQYLTTGSRSTGIAVGDLNHDGYDDIVTANFDDTSSVDVLLSNGDGTFAAPVKYRLYPNPLPNGNGPSSGTNQVVIADMNGDGIPDLVTADRNANAVSVLLGNGDGSFGPNNGDGTFGSHYSVWPQRGPVSLAVGDFNGDRKNDIVAASSLTAGATVLLNQGNGTFGDVMSYPVPSVADRAFVTAADLNGDGAADVVWGDLATNSVSLFLNSRDFTLVPGITPVFSNLSAPTITAGTATATFSGTLGGNGLVPSGSVLITLNHVTKKAPIDPVTGQFSATFATSNFLVSPLPYPVSCDYAGDVNFDTGQATSDLVVTPLASPSATTLTCSASPSVYGQEITFTATVAAGTTPLTSGTVTFEEGGTALTAPLPLDGNGQAQFTTATLSAAMHTLVAVYSGTGLYLASSGSLSTLVNADPTTTEMSSSVASAIPGQPVLFSATVSPTTPGSGTPTGSVDFFDATTNTDLGSVPLSEGTAILETSALDLGEHTITASYGGDGNFQASSAALTQNVTLSMYVLNQNDSGALRVSGHARIILPGNLIVDSKSQSALIASDHAQITAASIQVVGGYQDGQAALTPAPVTGVAVVADPLAGLVAPTGGTFQGSVSLRHGSLTINPGIYTSIRVSGDGSLTLNPGVYIIAGGGLMVSGDGNISGSGVAIYIAGCDFCGSSDEIGSVTLSGHGTLNLTAPTCGPYAGVVLFQARDNAQAITLSGNAAAGLGGTLYAPAARLDLSGDAILQGSLVVNELTLSGDAE